MCRNGYHVSLQNFRKLAHSLKVRPTNLIETICFHLRQQREKKQDEERDSFPAVFRWRLHGKPCANSHAMMLTGINPGAQEDIVSPLNEESIM
jgi:hypothetical protein